MDSEGKAGFHKGSKVSRSAVERKLADELERLKRRVGIGYEVEVKWFPGATKHRGGGKRLLEEVKGNNILIYTEDENEALKLVSHGFAEWLLNQHTKRYRLLINKLIEVFEQIQYEEKEKLIGAITKLIAN
jgi:signal recognition particle subunit SEC65